MSTQVFGIAIGLLTITLFSDSIPIDKSAKDGAVMMFDEFNNTVVPKCRDLHPDLINLTVSAELVEQCGRFEPPSKEELNKDHLEKFLNLEPLPALCYGLFTVEEAVCESSHQIDLRSLILPDSEFCKAASKIQLPEKCGLENCEVVKSIVSVFFQKVCDKECRQETNDQVQPVCANLYLALHTYLAQATSVNTDEKASEAPQPTEKGSEAPTAGSDKLAIGGTTSGEISLADAAAKPQSEAKADAGEQEASGGDQHEQDLMQMKEKEQAEEEARKQEEEEAARQKEDEAALKRQEEEEKKRLEAEQAKNDAANKAQEEKNAAFADAAADNSNSQDNLFPAKPPGLDQTQFKGPGISTMNQDEVESEPSNFLPYFMTLSLVCIVAYLVFHNKQKILALILEGRRNHSGRRRSRGREYRKLDNNLEESMDLNREARSSQVIY